MNPGVSTPRRRLGSALVSIALFTHLGSADAFAQKGGVPGPASTRAITVPWQGDPGAQHHIWSGGTLRLQGVARLAPGCSLVSAEWDPGDGTGFVAVSIADPRELELAHTYNAADGTPFVATLKVTDDCGTTASDAFRVRVVPKTLGAEVRVAIDHGLWNLHKRMNPGTTPNGTDAGSWQSRGYASSPTASAVLAFEIQGHREVGNDDEDPYVDTVRRGLAHVMTTLTSFDIGLQDGNDPDSNGNEKGLQITESGDHNSRPIYQAGQIVDAIVAAGTPGALATVGEATYVLGATYQAIAQDLMDAYAWGQTDANYTAYRGGWRYGWNGSGTSSSTKSDNSAAQWWAIGGIALLREFNGIIPEWVKTENLDYWIDATQIVNGSNSGSDGVLGYGDTSIGDASAMNTTPSGVVQMILDGLQSDHERFEAAEHYMYRNWSALQTTDRIYGMFAVAKAMRLASPAPVQFMSDGNGGLLDWYSSDTQSGDAMDGLARYLVGDQAAGGSWAGHWATEDLGTAWAVVILSSTIIQLGPVAVCDVDPQTTGINFPVEFDGSASFHLDDSQNVMLYEWDFDDDGTYDAEGPFATHAFAYNGTYQVTLRVTDDSEPPLIDTEICEVVVQPPPFPPNANPGGPYRFCMDENQPFLLDGTGSLDIDGQIVSYGWEFTPQPIDYSFDDATTAVVDVNAYFKKLGPGTYDVGLIVHDDLGNPNTDYTTVTVYAPGNCPPPPPLPCGEGEHLVISGFPKFSQLDGSLHDMDGVANGVLTVDGLTLEGQSYLKIDVPYAEFQINGDLVMKDDGTLGNDSIPEFGPDIVVVACGSVRMTDRSVIRSRGNQYGGHIKLCVEGDISLDVSAGIECNGFDLPQGLNGGTIEAYAGGVVQLGGYLTYMSVQSVEAGTIHIAACSTDSDAVRIDGRLLATGYGQNGTGGEIYLEARNGGVWCGGINHCVAIGSLAHGLIQIDVETAITPWYSPYVEPPAVVITDGPDKGPCACSKMKVEATTK